MPLVTFENHTAAAIRAHLQTAADAGREGCGLLLGMPGGPEQWAVQIVVPSQNAAPDPVHQWMPDVESLKTAQRLCRDRGVQWIGCFHSHPPGHPEVSAFDTLGLPPGMFGLLVAPGGEPTIYLPGGSPPCKVSEPQPPPTPAT